MCAEKGSDWLARGERVTPDTPGAVIPDFGTRPFHICCGDALMTILALREGGVLFDCVVTSPPYYKQRRYGQSSGESGQEKSVSDYISSLVTVFKAIPLRPWASVWVNIGDKRGNGQGLLCVPERFVIAMLDAGFFLIDKVVWAKEASSADGKGLGHCMIEPAPRRLNGNAWEPFFRFVADPKRAWTDTCAVGVPRDEKRFFHKGTETVVAQHPYSNSMACVTSLEGRNRTNVWYVGGSRDGKGHFAAYPKALVEVPIAMTCPEWLVDVAGVVEPRVRIVEPTEYSEGPGRGKRAMGQYSLVESRDEGQLTREEQKQEERRIENLRERSGRLDFARGYLARYPKSKGWTNEDKPVVGPGIVLDPFGGIGTTGHVAILLGRRFIGVELYPEVAARMEDRCRKAFETLRRERETIPTTR